MDDKNPMAPQNAGQHETFYIKKHYTRSCLVCYTERTDVTRGSWEEEPVVTVKKECGDAMRGCCGKVTQTVKQGDNKLGYLQYGQAMGGMSSIVYVKDGSGPNTASVNSNSITEGSVSMLNLGCCSSKWFLVRPAVQHYFVADTKTGNEIMGLHTERDFKSQDGKCCCCPVIFFEKKKRPCCGGKGGWTAKTDVLGNVASGSPVVGSMSSGFVNGTLCCCCKPPVAGGIVQTPLGTGGDTDNILNWVTLWQISLQGADPFHSFNYWKNPAEIGSIEEVRA